MAYQNINQYNYRKIGLKPVNEILDFCLADDARDFNQEVIFSPLLIAEDDGNRMPFKFDFNSSGTTISPLVNDFLYDTIVSENYYNPDDIDPNFCPVTTEICDVGLTGIDNGLTKEMSGITMTAYTGLYTTTAQTYNRYIYDRRFKMHPISGNTTPNNRLWNDNSYAYGLSYVDVGGDIGTVAKLNGGFYQGFYKLQGYDYEVFPTRVSQGWSVEMLLKYQFTGDTNIGLNARYPENKGTFFFMGSRAENKFYHYADGSPSSDTGYTRVTSGLTCMHTCGCSISGGTGADCIPVYQPSGVTSSNCGCGCPCSCSTEASIKELDPLYDGVSNAMSIRFSGDTGNPRVCVKEYLITGSCVPSGTCLTGTTYVTGVTTVEWCSTKGIFDSCVNTLYPELEHWVQIDAVFERNEFFDCGDLYYLGGLGQVEALIFTATPANNSVSLVMPPITHEEGYSEYIPAKTTQVKITDLWLEQKEFRKGTLKIFVNGRLFMVCEDFEEIIPRPLNTFKERQVGVPFNISVGGGTQGLKDNLTFSGTCPAELSGMTYQQDPECLTTDDLDNTTYSGLTTNIFLEEIFGGSFIGQISTFTMYVEPLDASEVKHNFRILKNKYDLLDPDCPDCFVFIAPTPSPTVTVTQTPSKTPTNTPTATPTKTPTNTPTVTPTNTPTETATNTPTPTITQTETGTNTPTPTTTETPTNTPSVTPTITQTETGTNTPTPTTTETPTNTPTETPTNTPSETPTNTPSDSPTNTPTPTTTPTQTNTNTPTVSPTNTPTPSTSPVALTGYSFNLVALPYSFPSSGNSIMNSAGGITSGSTDINVLATGGRGFYLNSIDSESVNRTNYYSVFTGQSVTITFYQAGITAIYSGDTDSFKYWQESPSNNGFVFGAGIGAPPTNVPSGNAVLIQSATTQFTIGVPVYVSLVINPGVTPTPSPTSTQTPTQTPTSSLTPSFTPTTTPTQTPTNTQTPTPTSTNTTNLQGFNYPNFASTDGITLVGAAAVSGGTIIALTTTTSASVGNMYRTTAIQYNRNFSAQWSSFIGGGTGADGYCVQWTTTNNTIGTSGGGVGRIESSSTINAIGFYTFTNNNFQWWKNNILQSTESVSSGFWRQQLYFWGDYIHSSQTFNLYFNTINVKPPSPNKQYTSFVFDTGSYYMGFGAAIGGSNDNQEILSWSLQFT
jgi:hypothetical protein